MGLSLYSPIQVHTQGITYSLEINEDKEFEKRFRILLEDRAWTFVSLKPL